MSNELSGLKVLVVDDDLDLREIMAEDFADFGAEVQMAESGNAAFELVKKSHFDLVVSDMRMPNGDGRSLVSNIKKFYSSSDGSSRGKAPLFFIYSGYNDLETKEAREIGITQVFSKPLRFTEMLEAIKTHMKR